MTLFCDHDAAKAAQLSENTIRDNQLAAIITDKNQCNLWRTAGVVLSLDNMGSSQQPTIAVRPLVAEDVTDTEALPSLSRAGVESHVPARLPAFAKDNSIDAAASVVVKNARRGRDPAKIKRQTEANSQLSIETVYRWLARCDNDLAVQIVIVPLTRRMTALLAGDDAGTNSARSHHADSGRSQPNHHQLTTDTDFVAVGITVAGSQTGQSSTAANDVTSVAKTMVPATSGRGSRRIGVCSRDPDAIATRFKSPDTRPEPTGWPHIAAYVLRGYTAHWNPIGDGMAGTPAKLVGTSGDLVVLLDGHNANK